MSLATRCTACDTMFRVVQDQLKVSEGWVRCGRCGEIFNALQGMFDLDGGRPTPVAPKAPKVSTAEANAPVMSRPSDADAHVDHINTDLPRDPQLFSPERAELKHAPADTVNPRDRMDFADARFDANILDEAVDSGPESGGFAATDGLDNFESSTVVPDFIREADERTRPPNPYARAGLWLLGFVLTFSLATQATYHFRDLFAAQWPEMQPALEAMCQSIGCTIEPLLRIDDIVLENSAMTAAPSGDAFKLSLTLRNRGSLPLPLPAVELTLTDGTGQTLARRDLLATDFTPTDSMLAPSAEKPLTVVLTAGRPRPSGYAVEVFYP